MKYTREQCRAIWLAFVPSMVVMLVLEMMFRW